MEQSEAALQPVGASRNWDEDPDPNEVRSLAFLTTVAQSLY